MHTVAETIGFFSVFLVFSIVFFSIGLYTIRKPESTAGFFNGVGSHIYGRKIADRVYTPRNLLWAAWPFAILAPLGAAAAIYQIAHAIVTGVGS